MTQGQRAVATSVLRGHRSLRRHLPRLGRLAVGVDGDATEARRAKTAARAAAILERDLLGPADVEDVLLARFVRRHGRNRVVTLLQPQHDTLRDATARLRDHAEAPDDRTDLGGMLLGIGQVLHRHLDDEWQVLVAALAELDDDLCGTCEALVGDTTRARPSGRLLLPVPVGVADSLLEAVPQGMERRLVAAATTSVRRAARQRDLPMPADLGLTIRLARAVAGPELVVHAGRLRSRLPEAVLGPVDFELVLSPRGARSTEVELHHVLVPSVPGPAPAPAGELADTALHAAVGEWAAVVGGRRAAA